MKLTYWVSHILDDHSCYNIRARTKKECERLRQEFNPERFGPVRKVVFNYDSAFDLIETALGEGGHSMIEGFAFDH